MEQPPVRTHWYTDRGRRPSNEDAVMVEALRGGRDLVAVADGMGGHAGGEVASGKALETLLSYLEASNDLAAAIQEANSALQRASEANPEWRGMGTTVVALLRTGDSYHVANVGDSRAYRVDAHGIQQITVDHSFTAEAVSSGRLSEHEAERSPWRNALTRAVGTDAEVEVDVFGPFALEPPHVVVLCTDGLYRVMSDEELGREVLAARERVDDARDLVATALRRGSSDNISVALVEFGDVESLGSTVAEDEGAVGSAAAASAPVPGAAGPVAEPVPERESARSAVGADASSPAKQASGASATEKVAEGGPPEVLVGLDSTEEPAEAAVGAATPTREEAEVRVDASVAEDSVDDLREAEAAGPPSESVVAEHASGGADPASPDRSEIPAAAEAPGSATEVPAAGTAEPKAPAVEVANVTSSYRKARPARPQRQRPRRAGRGPRKLPSWVRRELIPAAILVLGTLAIVYVLTSMFG